MIALKRVFLLLFICAFTNSLLAQVENTGMTDHKDSSELGKFKISGYVDVYYTSDLGQAPGQYRPYAVSSNRLNEVGINLAYIDLKYQGERYRARIVPGFGSYINENYAAEKGSLKNLLEASAGIKIGKQKDIWIEAGIFGAPYTNESAISKDHLMYTRSFSAEYSPYYLSGLRITYPVNEKLNVYGYLINGWQQIYDINEKLSGATQVEYKINKQLLVNWSTYIGSEKNNLPTTYGTRFFNDIYFIYKPVGNFSFTSSASLGQQKNSDTLNKKEEIFTWWQLNFIGQYRFNKSLALAGRIEYIDDPNGVVVQSLTSQKQFSCYTGGLCLNINISPNALLRFEGRRYGSAKSVFPEGSSGESKSYHLLSGNLTVWF